MKRRRAWSRPWAHRRRASNRVPCSRGPASVVVFKYLCCVSFFVCETCDEMEEWKKTSLGCKANEISRGGTWGGMVPATTAIFLYKKRQFIRCKREEGTRVGGPFSPPQRPETRDQTATNLSDNQMLLTRIQENRCKINAEVQAKLGVPRVCVIIR